MKNMSRTLLVPRPEEKKRVCVGGAKGKVRQPHLAMHSVVACLGDIESRMSTDR